MARRSGSADLPLHGGRVPDWLGRRMARLGVVIVEAILLEYGRDEVLARLAHPFWFQSLGAVMGMDWHSSGITTSVLAALQRGLAPRAGELGLHVCGGRGGRSRQTPQQLAVVGERTGLDGAALARTSRLVAKVDSAAVQDGFELYLHGFVVADDGKWVVVQQGMNPATRTARRYHWHSETVRSFVEAPHAAIEGRGTGEIVNLTDRRAAASRAGQLALLGSAGPDGILRALAGERRPGAAASRRGPGAAPEAPRGAREGRWYRASPLPFLPHLAPDAGDLPGGAGTPPLPHLVLPAHHDVRPKDVMLRRLHGALAAAADRAPADFAELLLVPGVGARTVLALAMVAEVVHGAPCRFADPARFALAHGGKDGAPFPVPTAVYDRTIAVMKAAVARARLGDDERLAAIRRLDAQARRLEAAAGGPDLGSFVAEERRRSAERGGRSVFGQERPRPAGSDAEAG